MQESPDNNKYVQSQYNYGGPSQWPAVKNESIQCESDGSFHDFKPFNQKPIGQYQPQYRNSMGYNPSTNQEQYQPNLTGIQRPSSGYLNQNDESFPVENGPGGDPPSFQRNNESFNHAQEPHLFGRKREDSPKLQRLFGVQKALDQGTDYKPTHILTRGYESFVSRNLPGPEIVSDIKPLYSKRTSREIFRKSSVNDCKISKKRMEKAKTKGKFKSFQRTSS